MRTLFCLFLMAAEPAFSLTWEEALAEASSRHPSLRAAEADLRAAEADRGAKRAAFLPKVDASADLGRSGSAPANGSAAFPLGPAESGSGSYGAGLKASWRLFDGFGSLRQLQDSGFQLMARRAALAQEGVDVLRQLRAAFIRVLYAQGQVEVAGSILERRALSAKYQKLKFEAGRQARWIWKKAEADAMEARWRVEQAGQDLDVALKELAQALGRDLAEGLKAEGSLDAGEPPELEMDAWESLPALQRLHAQRLGAEARVGAARAAHWPSLSANAGWNYSGDEAWPPLTRSWSVGLGAGFNLFNGGSTYYAVSAAEEALESLRQQEQDTRRGLRVAMLRAQARALSAARHVAVADAQLEAARERYETVAKLSEAGRAGYLDLEQAESALSSAQQQGLALRQEAALARADLDAALGRGLRPDKKEKP